MKYYGKLGFIEDEETKPGVHTNKIVEKAYKGDVIRNMRNLEQGESTNDSVDISNTISVVADEQAYRNIHSLRYLEWMGVKWKVRSVEVNRPRLILTIGGVWNENS